MKKKENTNEPFSCTYYTNCFADKGTKYNYYNWMYLVKSDQYKEPIEEIRRLTAMGDKEDKVKTLKNNLPAICPCGYLPKGRKRTDPIQLSLIMWIDYDIHERAWSEESREKLKGIKGVIGSYLTPREGLRVFVKMPDSLNLDNFDLYCQVMVDEIDEFLGAKHDEQTTTPVHLTSVSYDPDAWIVTPDKVTDFPIKNLLAKNEQKIKEKLAQLDSQGEDEHEDDDIDDEFKEIYEKFSRQEKNSYSKAQIDDMLMRFVGYNPLEPGTRNKNLLKLGQRAYYKRFTQEELDYLVEATHHLVGSREYTPKRIRQCLYWGYTHCDKQEICKTIARSTAIQDKDEKGPSLSHLSHLSHTDDSFGPEPLKLSDAQGVYDEVVRKSCPYFSTQVYDNLPPFFTDLLCYGNTKRDIDALLASLFTVMSGLMPNVTVQVRETDYSPNLFFLMIAPAASGKSVILKPHALLRNLKISIAMKNQKEKKEHEQKLFEWERYKKNCIKTETRINWDLKVPEKFIPKILEEAPQASRSKLITDLAQNPNGMITMTSELDIYSEALHCDYGDHSGELRAIPSNERISQSYKNAEDIIEQEFPRLSLVASGTPLQFTSFIGNTHDGMVSRCLTMLGENNTEWLSWADADESGAADKKKRYQEAAKKCCEIYEWLEKYPTHVTIPKELRAKCDVLFSYFNMRLIEDGYINLKSMVNRAPIHVSRICSILAAMRKVEEQNTDVEIEANEQDMEVAMGMVTILLKHGCVATTMLVEDGRQINNIKNVFKLEDIYRNLPEQFATEEIVKTFSEKAGYARATINRILKRWIEDKFITKVRHGFYAKTGKLMLVP